MYYLFMVEPSRMGWMWLVKARRPLTRPHTSPTSLGG